MTVFIIQLHTKECSCIMEKFEPKRIEKEIISLRIERNLLEEIDVLASKNDISRNEFIIQSVKFSIKNMQNK